MKLNRILVLAVVSIMVFGFLGVETVHAQRLKDKWYKGKAKSVEIQLMDDGTIEVEPVLTPIFVYFFENLGSNGCNGFNYDVRLVGDLDGNGEPEMFASGVFSTCGLDEKGAVSGFSFTTPDDDVITVKYNGKLVKGKKFVSQGCVILIDTDVDRTGQNFPETITKNCKITFNLIDCNKLPFIPPIVHPDLPPCL